MPDSSQFGSRCAITSCSAGRVQASSRTCPSPGPDPCCEHSGAAIPDRRTTVRHVSQVESRVASIGSAAFCRCVAPSRMLPEAWRFREMHSGWSQEQADLSGLSLLPMYKGRCCCRSCGTFGRDADRVLRACASGDAKRAGPTLCWRPAGTGRRPQGDIRARRILDDGVSKAPGAPEPTLPGAGMRP